MKIAVEFQSGERMTASTSRVTHASPTRGVAGGCSLFA
jgi:hypothetical protein